MDYPPIIDKLIDIAYHLLNKKPLWKDAVWCGKRYCRFCGGKKYAKNNKI